MKRAIWVDERWPLPARKLYLLVQQMFEINRQQAEQVIQAGAVRVNGRVSQRPQIVLEIGDRVEAQYDPAALRENSPTLPRRTRDPAVPLEIVFQDEHLVVVNKPPALLTVPTPYREKTTLISLLEKRLQKDRTGEHAFCVHRLDRGVSGLLVFGKQLSVAETLREQFESRKPQRRYVAIVAGIVSQRTGTFRSFLATDKQLNRYSTASELDGELAITHYSIQRTGTDATMVEVRLETGRRNQIRVHFAEAGHPVWGDPRYGGRTPRILRQWPHRRMALHAQSLAFDHPLTGRPLEFHSPLPREMASAGWKNAGS